MKQREAVPSGDTLTAGFNGGSAEKVAAVSFHGTGRLQMSPSQQVVQTCTVLRVTKMQDPI